MRPTKRAGGVVSARVGSDGARARPGGEQRHRAEHGQQRGRARHRAPGVERQRGDGDRPGPRPRGGARGAGAQPALEQREREQPAGRELPGARRRREVRLLRRRPGALDGVGERDGHDEAEQHGERAVPPRPRGGAPRTATASSSSGHAT